MTSKMLKIRTRIIIGAIFIIFTAIVYVLVLQNKENVHETVSKEMETISSSINDDVMTGVVDYLQQVLPDQESSGLDGEAYNKILETVEQSMKNSLKQKLNGTLTTDDISALEHDITAIVKQCIASMNLDSTKPVKGVDYFTDTEIENISKTVSTIVESNIEKTLSSDIEGNATSLSVLKAMIESNINAIKSSLKSCQDDITSLKNKMNEVSGSGLADLKTQYGSLYTSLNIYKASANAAISAVDSKAETANSKAKTNSESIANLKSELNDTKEQLLAELKAQYNSLNTSLNTYKTTVNAAIADLNDEVKDTKEQLDVKVSMSVSKINGIDTLTITSGVTKE